MSTTVPTSFTILRRKTSTDTSSQAHDAHSRPTPAVLADQDLVNIVRRKELEYNKARERIFGPSSIDEVSAFPVLEVSAICSISHLSEKSNVELKIGTNSDSALSKGSNFLSTNKSSTQLVDTSLKTNDGLGHMSPVSEILVPRSATDTSTTTFRSAGVGCCNDFSNSITKLQGSSTFLSPILDAMQNSTQKTGALSQRSNEIKRLSPVAIADFPYSGKTGKPPLTKAPLSSEPQCENFYSSPIVSKYSNEPSGDDTYSFHQAAGKYVNELGYIPRMTCEELANNIYRSDPPRRPFAVVNLPGVSPFPIPLPPPPEKLLFLLSSLPSMIPPPPPPPSIPLVPNENACSFLFLISASCVNGCCFAPSTGKAPGVSPTDFTIIECTYSKQPEFKDTSKKLYDPYSKMRGHTHKSAAFRDHRPHDLQQHPTNSHGPSTPRDHQAFYNKHSTSTGITALNPPFDTNRSHEYEKFQHSSRKEYLDFQEPDVNYSLDNSGICYNKQQCDFMNERQVYTPNVNRNSRCYGPQNHQQKINEYLQDQYFNEDRSEFYPSCHHGLNDENLVYNTRFPKASSKNTTNFINCQNISSYSSVTQQGRYDGHQTQVYASNFEEKQTPDTKMKANKVYQKNQSNGTRPRQTYEHKNYVSLQCAVSEKICADCSAMTPIYKNFDGNYQPNVDSSCCFPQEPFPNDQKYISEPCSCVQSYPKSYYSQCNPHLPASFIPNSTYHSPQVSYQHTKHPHSAFLTQQSHNKTRQQFPCCDGPVQNAQNFEVQTHNKPIIEKVSLRQKKICTPEITLTAQGSDVQTNESQASHDSIVVPKQDPVFFEENSLPQNQEVPCSQLPKTLTPLPLLQVAANLNNSFEKAALPPAPKWNPVRLPQSLALKKTFASNAKRNQSASFFSEKVQLVPESSSPQNKIVSEAVENNDIKPVKETKVVKRKIMFGSVEATAQNLTILTGQDSRSSLQHFSAKQISNFNPNSLSPSSSRSHSFSPPRNTKMSKQATADQRPPNDSKIQASAISGQVSTSIKTKAIAKSKHKAKSKSSDQSNNNTSCPKSNGNSPNDTNFKNNQSKGKTNSMNKIAAVPKIPPAKFKKSQ